MVEVRHRSCDQRGPQVWACTQCFRCPHNQRPPRAKFKLLFSGGFTLQVRSGKTYVLRLINAALNEELFFKVAGHTLTVVEVEATYTKPFKTDTILIAPGQTTNVLLTAGRSSGRYLVTTSPFMEAPVAMDNTTATAILHHKGTLAATPTMLTTPPPKMLLQLLPASIPACAAWTQTDSLRWSQGRWITPSFSQ